MTPIEIKRAEILFERRALQEQYDSHWNFSPYTDTGDWLNWKRNALKLLDLKSEDKILDYGCATCETSEWLAAQGYDVIALDICFELLTFSRKRAEKFGYKGLLKYCCADCERLPFHDKTFDKIFCFDVLHHLPEPEKGLDELYRVLKPGGSCLAYEPNALSPVRRLSQWRWKESSLETSFYPWTLYQMFKERFGIVSISFAERPLNPWSQQWKNFLIPFWLWLANTKVLSPFLGGIMCIAQKQR